MNWFKQTLANVVGMQEPEYGPEAIQTVTAQTVNTPWTELTREDLKWKALESTNVESQTFYLISDAGMVGFVQVIYNNVAGLHTTCQFNTKLFSHTTPSTPHLWLSDPLTNNAFSEDQTAIYADNLALTLNPAGDTYTIKSAVNAACLVSLSFTRAAPGFQAGVDGTSYYGTDPARPWGEMRHRFWPRCTVSGSITTPELTHDLKGRGMLSHALQGMKPHHAAARWNFGLWVGERYSAVMMEFTTPRAYGETVVNVGSVARDGEVVVAGAGGTFVHVRTKEDAEALWMEPTAVELIWKGVGKKGFDVVAELKGELGERKDRIDVLAHIPGIIKSLVGGVVGTRPYIYQYSSPPREDFKFLVKEGDGPAVEEQGTFICEATFIL